MYQAAKWKVYNYHRINLVLDDLIHGSQFSGTVLLHSLQATNYIAQYNEKLTICQQWSSVSDNLTTDAKILGTCPSLISDCH